MLSLYSIISSATAVLVIFAYCGFVVAGSIHSITHHHGAPQSTGAVLDLADLGETDKSGTDSPENSSKETTDCYLCLQGKTYSTVFDQSHSLELISRRGLFPTILPELRVSKTPSLPFLRAPPSAWAVLLSAYLLSLTKM